LYLIKVAEIFFKSRVLTNKVFWGC